MPRQVLLRLSNGPEQPDVVTLPKHKKHPPAGVKATTRSKASRAALPTRCPPFVSQQSLSVLCADACLLSSDRPFTKHCCMKRLARGCCARGALPERRPACKSPP